MKQVNINGSKHAIMMRGYDKNNPVVIFVHGGAGCPEIPYVTKYQDILEKNFTVVQYDQRGTGKSFHFFEDYSGLSADVLAKDLIDLTDYIRKELNKEKVILAAHYPHFEEENKFAELVRSIFRENSDIIPK